MQHQLVNEDYLSNLISLSREQKDDDLVTQLFKSLQTDYRSFLNDCSPEAFDADQRKEFQHRIHRLKNNFYNLGCEEAGAVLEEMYQVLKAENPAPMTLKKLWERFETASEQTFSQLTKTIANH